LKGEDGLKDLCLYERMMLYSTRFYGNRLPNGAWGCVGRSRDRFPVVSLGIFSMVLPTEPCALRST